MTSGALLVALFNGAWQGALLCLTAKFALRFARTLNAATMFAVWSVLLAICVVLPAANAFAAARVYTVHVAAPVVHAAVERAAVLRAPAISRPAANVSRVSPEPQVPQPSLAERALSLGVGVMQNAWMVLAALGIIAGIRLLMLGREIAGMVSARRATTRIDAPVAARLSIGRPYAFASSPTLTSPCVLGFAPALIVIPSELLGASERELLSVVLHEAEHVRRYDDVQNLVHRLLGAIAFFCPGVRMALRELALFREQICDDAAVSGLGDPVAYAMTLTGMAQWAQGRGVPVPSLIFKRKQLLRRLDVLLDRAMNHSLRLDRRFAFSAALSMLLAAAFVVRVQVPVLAEITQRIPAPPPVRAVIAKPRAAHLAPVAALPAPHVAAIAKVAKPAVAKAAKPAIAKAPATKAKAAAKARASAKNISPRVRVKGNVSAVRYRVSSSYAYAYAQATTAAITAPKVALAAVTVAPTGSEPLLEALEAAGMRSLTVDQLIALRDHGVSAPLVMAAHQMFQGSLTAESLVRLADHGVGAVCLQSFHDAGLRDLTPDDTIRLRDHGVDGPFIARVRSYNPHATVSDIIKLRDSGF